MGYNSIIFSMFVSVGSIGESIIAICEFDELDNENVMGINQEFVFKIFAFNAKDVWA